MGTSDLWTFNTNRLILVSVRTIKIGINDMKYEAFLTVIRKNKLYIFSADEMSKYFPGSSSRTSQNQLQSWAQKGLMIRLKRGLYQIRFAEGGPELPDLYVANRLYEPSYVSLETMLSFYSLIPEVAAGVTSVTTRQTKYFRNKLGGFKYSSCKTEAFGGYRIMLYEGFKVYVAEPEKALVDFVYFKRRSGQKIDLEGERFDQERLRKLSWRKVFHYAGLYNKKTLAAVKRIKGEFK